LTTSKPGRLLKQQIPVRTFIEWTDGKPGVLETDLVAHCGGSTEGTFLYTLTLTDVATDLDRMLAAAASHPAWRGACAAGGPRHVSLPVARH
jgi:hypothetical protein